MDLSNVLLAKSNNGRWLSLKQHLEDTRGVMEMLLENGFIAPSIITASGLSYEELRNICIFVAAVHDIGKATSLFQYKVCESIPWLKGRLAEYGFDVDKNTLHTESPHALAGAAILNNVFEVDESICDIIAAHHGKPRNSVGNTKFSRQFKVFIDNYYSEQSEEAYRNSWTEIYDYAIKHADINGIVNLSVKSQMIISGLLVMADWIASNEIFFPLFDDIESIPDNDRLQNGIKLLGINRCHESATAFMDADLFKSRFGFEPNDFQKQIIAIANNISTPGIMIIEAPMGIGKTEAALAVAEIESGSNGSGGIFFGLPTRGTADGIFPRIKKWVSEVSEGENVSINLAHSNAKFNSSFTDIKANVDDEDTRGISVNSWMTGKYKKLLSDFVVGTVDQALFLALKRKFLMLLHLGMAGKTIIIDEVHSYDDYMSQYMFSMLSWLGAYKVPVILLSATLTKAKRNDCVTAYSGMEVSYDTDEYPSVTWTDGQEIHVKALTCKDLKPKSISIEYIDDGIISLLKDKLSAGGCAGIVVNTVRAAQDMYDLLFKALPEEFTVILLHSRFLPYDRANIEEKVMTLVGKNSKDRNKIIVVGTQVLEQSLDIDFDILFTDKCPVDLLFQRLGRLHRHMRTRPEKVQDAKCYILNSSDSCKRSEKIYFSYIIHRTDECIKEKCTLVLPDDIREVTEKVYNTDITPETEEKKEYLSKRFNSKLKANNNGFLLPPINKCKFKGMLLVNQEVKGEGNVRDGVHSIEVILLYKCDCGVKTASGEIIDLGIIPDQKQTEELLKSKLSLRYDDQIEEDINVNQTLENKYKEMINKWKRLPALENELFIILDEEGKTSLGKHSYSYSNIYGWREDR